MTEHREITAEAPPRLGEMGLDNFAPYLMNRIMGRYNASLREDMAHQGMSTPKMRASVRRLRTMRRGTTGAG